MSPESLPDGAILLSPFWARAFAALMLVVASSFGAWALVVDRSRIAIELTMQAQQRNLEAHERERWHSEAGLEIAKLVSQVREMQRRIERLENVQKSGGG